MYVEWSDILIKFAIHIWGNISGKYGSGRKEMETWPTKLNISMNTESQDNNAELNNFPLKRQQQKLANKRAHNKIWLPNDLHALLDAKIREFVRAVINRIYARESAFIPLIIITRGKILIFPSCAPEPFLLPILPLIFQRLFISFLSSFLHSERMNNDNNFRNAPRRINQSNKYPAHEYYCTLNTLCIRTISIFHVAFFYFTPLLP